MGQDVPAYRADTKAFLEYCQEHHLRAPLSQSALEGWLAHLDRAGISEDERHRVRRSVETLFRHIGVLPDLAGGEKR